MAAPDTRARSVSGLGKWLVALLGLAVFVDLAAVVAGLVERDLFTRIAEGSFSAAEANASDARMAMIGVAQISIYLVTGVVFIVWFHRAYKNLRAFGAELPHTSGWAIGAWFVPFLNLVRPKRIADAIWRASDAELDHPAGLKWAEAKVPAFVHIWWVTWIVSAILGRVYFSLSRSIETVEQAQSANAVGLGSDGLSVIAGLCAIAFVNGATKRQELRMRQPVVPPPPPESGNAGSQAPPPPQSR